MQIISREGVLMSDSILLCFEGVHHVRHISRLLADNGRDYEVCGGFDDQEIMLSHVQKKIAQGAQVIISSGGYCDYLSQKVDVPVVAIRRSRFPFAGALKKARALSSKVAILAREGVFYDAACQYVSTFDDPVPIEHFRRDEDIMENLRRLKADGIEVLVVGSWGGQIAPTLGFTCITVPFEERDLMSAVYEAEHILRYLESQQETSKLLKLIQNSVSEGILAVDEELRITEINNFALNMVAADRQSLDKRPIGETPFAPIAELDAFATSDGCTGEIVTVNNHLLTVSVSPVSFRGKTEMKVITFTPIKQLQASENEVRAKLAAKGHVASYTFDSIVGVSTAIQETIHTAKKFARVDSSVLISAPSGCGKEMFAQSIHNSSRRKDAPFVVINCAALPESLLESLLFGYEKGAYTGAAKEGRQGLFLMAHGGTVFLDEISEMPLSLQSRFLRTLQEKEISPLGSDRVIPVDIRVLAATNRDMLQRIADGKFREDLYYRLAVLQLDIPPLSAREGDVPHLVRYFLYEKSRELKLPCPEITEEALGYLSTLDYPGNVRQLGNIVERILVLHEVGEQIDLSLVQAVTRQHRSVSEGAVSTAVPRQRDLAEKARIAQALSASGGSRKEAAGALGLSTTTLWRKMKKYGFLR